MMGYLVKKVLGVLVVLVMAGCGVPQGEGVKVTPTAERVVLPTVTAMVRVTPTAGLSQAELEAVWRLPIVVSALNFGICVEGQRVLTALAAGEVARPEGVRRLEALAIVAEISAEGLAGWEPNDEALVVLKRLLGEETEAVQVAVQGWLSGEIDDVTAGEALGVVCMAVDGTGERVSEGAIAAGFRAAGVQGLLEETQAIFVDMLGGGG